eukprot:comp12157_c0_seq1/m.15704 comp12157_c0_seq1/g.15704  ORF comp12157_c0_seq1/g.15704 comp12157_c0_seq1/m.15704 type:complete len:378 (-) comp12157_c0_seq1:2-1135(-)
MTATKKVAPAGAPRKPPSLRIVAAGLNKLTFDDMLTRAGDLETLNATERINLAGNALSDLPDQLGRLMRIRAVCLTENAFTRVPFAIMQLRTIHTLEINMNKLKSLKGIARLTALESLTVGINEIEELDQDDFAPLTKLHTLHVNCNRIPELPMRFSACTSHLKILSLSNNKLTELPADLSGWKTLEELYLSGNKLSFFPPQVAALVNLRILTLNRNQMQGAVPPEIESCLQLTQLHIARDFITSLPSSIAKLTLLEDLEVQLNNLSSLPSEIWELPNLRNFNAGYNHIVLQSEIPPRTTSNASGNDLNPQKFKPTISLRDLNLGCNGPEDPSQPAECGPTTPPQWFVEFIAHQPHLDFLNTDFTATIPNRSTSIDF